MNMQIEQTQRKSNGSEYRIENSLDTLAYAPEKEEPSIRNYSLKCPLLSRVGKLESAIEQHLFSIQRGQEAMNADTSSIHALASSVTGVSKDSHVLYAEKTGLRNVSLVVKGKAADFYHVESFLLQNRYTMQHGRVVENALVSFNVKKVESAEYFQTYLTVLCNNREVVLHTVREFKSSEYSVNGIFSGKVEPVLQIFNFLRYNGWNMKLKNIKIQFANQETLK